MNFVPFNFEFLSMNDNLETLVIVVSYTMLSHDSEALRLVVGCVMVQQDSEG